MQETTSNSNLWRWLRWGLVGVVLVTVGSLGLTLWSSYRSAQLIAKKVIAAEGYQLIQQIRLQLSQNTGRVSKEDLDAIRLSLKDKGLHYVGLFQRLSGRQLAESGTRKGSILFPVKEAQLLAGPQQLHHSKYQLLAVGVHRKGRIHPWRRHKHPHPKWRKRPKPPGFWRRRWFHRLRRRLGRRRILLVVEFQPQNAQTLQSEATRTLVVGGVTGGFLVLLMSSFFLLMGRLERAEKQRESAQQLAVLGEMSAVLAHEIRNPLTSLKGNAQLLAEGLEEGTRPQKRAEKVVDDAIRLETLSNQLLDFVKVGKIDAAQRALQPFLERSLEAVPHPNHEFDLDLSQAPANWSFDAGKLQQVLINLVTNAVQAAPEGTTIHLKATQQGKNLHIELRDHGPGIKEEDMPNLFRPFFTTRIKGTGLGLAVAKRIVDLHKGSITVSHHPEGGAVFQITLPK